MKIEIENLYVKPDGRESSYRIKCAGTPLLTFYYQSPNYNCQIGSIARMDNIISMGEKESIDILKQIYKIHMPPMILVDVRDNEIYIKHIEKIFEKKDIVFKQKYHSTSGNDMVMYLLKTTNLREEKPLAV